MNINSIKSSMRETFSRVRKATAGEITRDGLALMPAVAGGAAST